MSVPVSQLCNDLVQTDLVQDDLVQTDLVQDDLIMCQAACKISLTVYMLLVKGANVGAKSRTGSTALTLAAANGHTEVVGLLNRHQLTTKSHLGMSNSSPYHSKVAAWGSG